MHALLHVGTENGCFQKGHWDFHDNSALQTLKTPRPSISRFTKNTNLGGENRPELA